MKQDYKGDTDFSDSTVTVSRLVSWLNKGKYIPSMIAVSFNFWTGVSFVVKFHIDEVKLLLNPVAFFPKYFVRYANPATFIVVSVMFMLL